MKFPDFRRAFTDNATFTREGIGSFRVRVRRVGLLHVPSGRVVACDPLVFPERLPYRGKVPAGRYPVLLSIAYLRGPKRKKGEASDQRIACAMLRFSRRAPVRWEMALCGEQDAAGLQENEYYGYPVDAGTGCFMDERAGKLLARRMKADHDYYHQLLAAARKVYVATREWADFRLDDECRLNVVFFSSGSGDGSYPSYWGYDRDGGRACLVTDFFILPR